MVVHDESSVDPYIDEDELYTCLNEIGKLSDEDLSEEEQEEGPSITKESENDDGHDEDGGSRKGDVDVSSTADSCSVSGDGQQVSESNQFVELDLKEDNMDAKKFDAKLNEDQSEISELNNGAVSKLAPGVLFSKSINPPNKDNSIEIKLYENGWSDEKGNFAKSNADIGGQTHKKTGLIRHCIAILGLSSILLANINRQVFNQGIVSMTKRAKSASELATEIVTASLITESPTTIQANTIKNLYYSSYETTSDFASTQEPQMELDSKFNASKPPPPPANYETTEGAAIEPIVEEDIELENDDRFDWSKEQESTLLSAFSYGYMPFMIIGGRMSEIYGAKWVVFLSGFGSAVCYLIMPYLADTSYTLLVCSRIFMGLCQTGVSPALYAMFTRWLPPDESSVYLPMIKVGVMIGNMFGSLICGFFPWRSAYYLTASIGILWSTLWLFLATSDPKAHNLIEKDELNYIQSELEKLNEGKQLTAKESRKQSAPWLSILTNPVFLAFMATKFTIKFSTDAQAQQIPKYLKSVFAVSDQFNGFLNASNFAIQGVFTGFVAYIAKEFVVRKTFGLSKTGVRRLFQGINNFGMALAYVLMSFNMNSLNIVCCSVIILSVTSMFSSGGEAVTPIDLSNEYSASIMAIANSCANLSGIIQPKFVAFLLGDDPLSTDNWNLVWRTLGATLVGGGLLFTFLVNAKIQDFTTKNEEKKDFNNNKPEIVIEMKSIKL